MYCKWEDGCIYSKGSSHAAGNQSTDKLDVKCGWQISTGTVFPINPSSHSLFSPLTPLNPA